MSSFCPNNIKRIKKKYKICQTLRILNAADYDNHVISLLPAVDVKDSSRKMIGEHNRDLIGCSSRELNNDLELLQTSIFTCLLPVVSIFIRVRGSVCVVLSIFSFSNDRQCLESYRSLSELRFSMNNSFASRNPG